MAEEAKAPKKIVPKKTPIPEQPPQKRRSNFKEVSLGYTPEMAKQEAARCLNCKKPGCVDGCPVNVPIPRFIKAISEGDFKKAISIIKEANLLPAVCGRVCPQESQCEKNCVLAKSSSLSPSAVWNGLRRTGRCRTAGPADAPGRCESRRGKVAIAAASGPGRPGLCDYDLASMAIR